jgi:hypothetical protein
VYVRHEAIKVRPSDRRGGGGVVRTDPFAELVRQVAADLANPFNIERFLWVLEEPPPRECPWCGTLFAPALAHDGTLTASRHRQYCSTRCVTRAAWSRRRARLQAQTLHQWGSAA